MDVKLNRKVYKALYQFITNSLGALIERAQDEDNEEEADYLLALLDEFTEPENGVIRNEAWLEAFEIIEP